MKIRKFKNIIFDFNGTLLNDVDLCVEGFNNSHLIFLFEI